MIELTKVVPYSLTKLASVTQLETIVDVGQLPLNEPTGATICCESRS